MVLVYETIFLKIKVPFQTTHSREKQGENTYFLSFNPHEIQAGESLLSPIPQTLSNILGLEESNVNPYPQAADEI